MTDDSDNTFTLKERVLQYVNHCLDEIADCESQSFNSVVNALCKAKTIKEAWDIWVCNTPSAFLRERDYIEFVVNKEHSPQPWTQPKLHPVVMAWKKSNK